MIKKLLRELYLLPRGEQRAIILLSLLMILGIVVRVTVQLLPEKPPPGMEEFVKESRAILAALQQQDSLEQSSDETSITYNGSLPPPHRSPFTDHPTPITDYRSPITHSPDHRSPTNRTPVLAPISINSADSSALLPLPDIGPVFAGRIIRYRELLGGFTGLDQLEEVYGLSGETIRLIGKYLQFDTSVIRKIRVDSATFRELLRHPYLEMEHVRALFQYRDFAGHIHSPEELRENHVLPDSVLRKVGPYLLF